VPEEGLRERAARDQAPYLEWAEQGLVIPTPGPVIDHRAVEAMIRRLAAAFDVQAVGFDRTFANRMMLDLQEAGLLVIEVRQGWVSQVPSVERLERIVRSRRLHHGGNTALRWMVENVAVKPAAEGKMLRKKDRISRIDAVAALWMAPFWEMNQPPRYIPLYTDDVEGLLSVAVH
jgi:phage terminase large subunit-like protein